MAPRQHKQPIFIVSGGVGASGELLVRTVLAQFPDVNMPVRIFPNIVTGEQLAAVIDQAAAVRATLVHTLVDATLRAQLIKLAGARSVTSVDLLGRLMDHLSVELEAPPVGQPGLYRTAAGSYFRRIEAIGFTVDHDDGKRVEDLPKADIVLLGPSRVGKTPISVYLSIQGWKVANVPLVPEISTPVELARVRPDRVVGLTIEPRELHVRRRARQRNMGIGEGLYTDQSSIVEALRAANHFYYQAGYRVIDVTDKPIETISEEILAGVTRGLDAPHDSAL
jgi:regulator of PEP synthase PpsR (kinase-PPPase family)